MTKIIIITIIAVPIIIIGMLFGITAMIDAAVEKENDKNREY